MLGRHFGSAVAVDSADNIIAGGRFYAPSDFGGGTIATAGNHIFVTKMEPTGNHLWTRAFVAGNQDAQQR